MTKFFLRLYDYFQAHKVLLWVSLILTTLLWGVLTTQLRFENDITSFLPDSKDSENSLVFSSLRLKDRIVVMLTSKDDEVNADELIEASDLFVQSLWERTDTNHVQKLTTNVNLDVAENTIDYIYSHLPMYMEDADYAQLDSMLQPANCQAKMADNFETILSPMGVGAQQIIMQDPLGMGNKMLAKLANFNQFDGYTIYDDYLFSEDYRTLFMFIDSRDGSNASPLNDELTTAIEDALNVVEKNYSSVKAECSGVGIVAVYNMRQIKKDLMITVNIALIVIIILILLAFKRKRTIFLLITPVIYGALFAAACVYIIQGGISAIAIGTGSVVLGVALSYSIHVICHANHSTSVYQIIEELVYPLTIGSITTIGAFIGLQFTSSPLLQDFGLFAACSLIGTTIFCLVFLPHFLVVDGDQTKRGFMKFIDRVNSYSYDRNKWLISILFIIIVVSLFFCGNVKFDYDMMKLYSEPEHLLAARHHLEQFAGEDDSNLLISYSKDDNTAVQEYWQTCDSIRKDIANARVEKMMSAADFLIPADVQQLRLEKWRAYWNAERIAAVEHQIETTAVGIGFSEGSFSAFNRLIEKDYKVSDMVADMGDEEMAFSSLVEKNADATLLLTQLWLTQEAKADVYPHVAQTASIVDRSYFIGEIAKQVNDDFNLILFISSFLIFGVLLISYGSIELALLAFLPMFISWFIILGFMALFGIEFNIVNIILSSFIFGIGDDFSIFVLDGLRSEYREGKQMLPSHKTAIFFSSLMTIIGMGVLIFAKNPAIRSLAIVSLLGIVVVVLVAYVLQPLLWRWIVTNQTNKRGLPHTIVSLLRSIIVLLAVIVSCLLLDLLIPVLLLIPCRMKQKRALFRKLLSWIAPFPIWVAAGLQIKINRNGEDFSSPSFIIANHLSMIDLLVVLQLTDKAIVVVRKWIWNSPFFFLVARFAGFINVSDGYDVIEKKLEEAFSNGLSVIVFPEGTRSMSWEVERFLKGTFYFAEKFHKDIIPIALYGTCYGYPKGQLYISNASMVAEVLPHIHPTDTSYGNTYQERSKSIREYIAKVYNQLRDQYDNMDNSYFRVAFWKGYIYKDIDVELRVMRDAFKHHFYRELDRQTPRDGVIVVKGGYYGAVAYALALVGKRRNVIAVSTHSEQVDFVNHMMLKNNNLTSVCVEHYEDYVAPDGAVVIDLTKE